MNRWFGWICAFSLVFMAAVAFIYLAPHFGWRIAGIGSGSMAPALQRGSLVVATPVQASQICLGDVIIYRTQNGDNLVCHRVVAIDDSETRKIVTRGDANLLSDANPVTGLNLVGRMWFAVPLLGFVAMFVNTLPGLMISLIVPGILLSFICLKSLRDEIRKSK